MKICHVYVLGMSKVLLLLSWSRITFSPYTLKNIKCYEYWKRLSNVIFSPFQRSCIIPTSMSRAHTVIPPDHWTGQVMNQGKTVISLLILTVTKLSSQVSRSVHQINLCRFMVNTILSLVYGRHGMRNRISHMFSHWCLSLSPKCICDYRKHPVATKECKVR